MRFVRTTHHHRLAPAARGAAAGAVLALLLLGCGDQDDVTSGPVDPTVAAVAGDDIGDGSPAPADGP